MKRPGYTLVELLVVISIIVLLMSLLLPALSRAKMAAQSAVCESNLRQIELAVTEYANAFHGGLPSSFFGPYAWQDAAFAFLYDKGTLQPRNSLSPALESQFQQAFWCPSRAVQMSNPWGLNYAANPVVFPVPGPPGPARGLLPLVEDPSQVIAVGDANQAFPDGGSWYTFDWAVWNNPAAYPPDTNIPAGGFFGTGNTDSADGNAVPSTGLRYRHFSAGQNSGTANVAYFDGHVSSMTASGNSTDLFVYNIVPN